MKTTLFLSTVLAGALASQVAFACGAPFGVGVNVDPNQDIILVHKNGVETYVFKPRFCGVAKDFGLILPIPSKLTVVPALEKDTAFTRLDVMSKPEVQNRTVCRNRGAMDAGVGVPNSRADAGATVVSTGKVGYLDYSELKADTEQALIDWLDANGYPYDSAAKATFGYYVQKGWLFLAFKISTGAVADGYQCNNLGPIRLTFQSAQPVVPTRMAAARPKDSSGSLAGYYGFSWRVFGITSGEIQVGLAQGDTSTRKLGYSGLVTAAEAVDLQGLAVTGDRVTRVVLGFPYNYVEPDVAFSLDPGKDFREIKYNDIVVDCPVPDAGITPDTRPVLDTRPATDAQPTMDVLVVSDATVGMKDTASAIPPVDAGAADASPAPDAQPSVDVYRPGDALAANTDTSSPSVPTVVDAGTPVEKKHSSGCAFAGSPSGSGVGILVLGAGLALALRRRRRSNVR